jgi:hypothetical protein
VERKAEKKLRRNGKKMGRKAEKKNMVGGRERS